MQERYISGGPRIEPRVRGCCVFGKGDGFPLIIFHLLGNTPKKLWPYRSVAWFGYNNRVTSLLPEGD